MRPLLWVVAMFKDEVESARGVLESALPHADGGLVLDTGSTDGTVELIRIHEFAGTSPPLLVCEEPIRHKLARGGEVFHFAANRNRALDLVSQLPEDSQRPVFTLFLSGHETLRGGDKLREFLEEQRDEAAGAYTIRVQSGTRAFGYTRVLRVDAGWRYRGVIHEVPESPGGSREAEPCPGAILHMPPDTDIERKVARIRNHDLPVLEEAASDAAVPMEQRADAVRMLGETHALLASEYVRAGGEEAKTRGGPWLTHQMIAMSCFFRYAVLAEPSDPEMAHYALALYYQLAGDVSWLYAHEELFHRIKVLVDLAPELVEAKFLLARAAVLTDARLGLPHALNAAKAARDAAGTTRRAPLETSLVWRSLLMAARCAEAIGQDAKSGEEKLAKMSQARRFMELAIKEGASRELLEKKDAPKEEEARE